jgi:hypothetical protein
LTNASAVGGSQQSAVTRKPYGLAGPKTIDIEVSHLWQRVIATAVRVAGKVIQLSQLPKHGDIDRGPESQLELPKIGDLVTDEELANSAGGKRRWSHNVIVPIESAYEPEL